MIDKEVERILSSLGTGGSSEIEASRIRSLRRMLGQRYPEFVLRGLPAVKRAKARTRLVVSLLNYVRENSSAFEASVLALRDRSKHVRAEATAVMAYSLDSRALPVLKRVLECEPEDEVQSHILAAIDAIENQNHHLYMDRDHSGMTTWNVINTIDKE